MEGPVIDLTGGARPDVFGRERVLSCGHLGASRVCGRCGCPDRDVETEEFELELARTMIRFHESEVRQERSELLRLYRRRDMLREKHGKLEDLLELRSACTTVKTQKPLTAKIQKIRLVIRKIEHQEIVHERALPDRREARACLDELEHWESVRNRARAKRSRKRHHNLLDDD